MDDILYDKDYLIGRVKQLEHERDELQKDIEQFCIQQAGSSYLVAAPRLHFQRTTTSEQEIDILKKKLAACVRDNSNLQEELSEAYNIKSQFADLHATELSKVLFSISKPDVFMSSNSDTCIIFGEAKIDDLSSRYRHKQHSNSACLTRNL